MAIPNVLITVQDGGVGIIIPGVGALPVNVAGWCSSGAGCTPTSIGVGQINQLTSTFGVGSAVELAAAILANGAPQGVIVTRIYQGTVAGGSTWTRAGGSAGVVTDISSAPLSPYGTPVSGGSTGAIISVVTGGALGTAQVEVSFDGGNTWTAPITTSAAWSSVPYWSIPGGPGGTGSSGLVVEMSAATYTVGTTFTGAIVSATGASSSVTQLPVPGAAIVGAGAITMDGTNNPQDAYSVEILITTSGVLGVGQFEYSLDDGLTFSGATLIPSGGGPTSLGTTGIAVDWSNTNTLASYTWTDTTDSDTVTFQAGTSFVGAAGNNLAVVVATGSSLSNSISTSGGITTVTLTIDTTVTTPALLATYVNTTAASTLAPYITISAHTGTTAFTVFLSSTPLAGGIGGGGSTSGFIAGESYYFTTTPPAITSTDIVNVMEAITGNALQWDWIHVVGRPTTASLGATLAGSVATQVGNWFANYRYSFAVLDAPICTVQNNISASLVSSYASVLTDYVAVGGGDANIVSAITGSEVQRCASWAASIWGSTLQIGTDLAQVSLGNLPFVAQILWNENNADVLDAARFTTLRTIPTLSGFYVTNARIMSNSATSDITYWQSRRVLNQACRIAYAFLVQYLSKNIPVNATTGTIDPGAATALQNSLNRALNQGLVGQVSGVASIVNTTNDVLSTQTLEVTVAVVPLFYPKTVSVTLGFTNPALSTQ